MKIAPKNINLALISTLVSIASYSAPPGGGPPPPTPPPPPGLPIDGGIMILLIIAIVYGAYIYSNKLKGFYSK